MLNKRKKSKKQGLSGIVTSIILIGLTLVAVGIVWFILQTAIQEENNSSRLTNKHRDPCTFLIQAFVRFPL